MDRVLRGDPFVVDRLASDEEEEDDDLGDVFSCQYRQAVGG